MKLSMALRNSLFRKYPRTSKIDFKLTETLPIQNLSEGVGYFCSRHLPLLGCNLLNMKCKNYF